MSDDATVPNESLEVPPKKKRNWVMTEARKAAFERCRQKRAEAVKQIQDKKTLQKIEAKQTKIKALEETLATRRSKRSSERSDEPPPSQESLEPTITEVKPKPKAPPKKIADKDGVGSDGVGSVATNAKPRLAKKQLVVVEESDNESSSSVELIIKRKDRKPKEPVSPAPDSQTESGVLRTEGANAPSWLETRPQYFFL